MNDNEMEHASFPVEIQPLKEFLDAQRAAHIQRALDACGGNRSRAATLLKIDVRHVFRFLEKERKKGLKP